MHFESTIHATDVRGGANKRVLVSFERIHDGGTDEIYLDMDLYVARGLYRQLGQVLERLGGTE